MILSEDVSEKCSLTSFSGKISISDIIKFCASNDDGWMICDFTSFSTVLQSYQDDGRMIMKGCVQWNPVYG